MSLCEPLWAFGHTVAGLFFQVFSESSQLANNLKPTEKHWNKQFQM